MSLMDINRTMNKKADAFSLLPEQQLQGMNMRGMQSLRRGISPDLVELLAVQDAIKRKNDSKNALMLAQEEDPNTVKSQKANELVEQSRQELGLPSQQEKAMAVAQVLANRQKTANKNLQQVMSKGLGGMKRPNMSVPMAQGGVVGYQEGRGITGEGVKDFLFGEKGLLAISGISWNENIEINDPVTGQTIKGASQSYFNDHDIRGTLITYANTHKSRIKDIINSTNPNNPVDESQVIRFIDYATGRDALNDINKKHYFRKPSGTPMERWVDFSVALNTLMLEDSQELQKLTINSLDKIGYDPNKTGKEKRYCTTCY